MERRKMRMRSYKRGQAVEENNGRLYKKEGEINT